MSSTNLGRQPLQPGCAKTHPEVAESSRDFFFSRLGFIQYYSGLSSLSLLVLPAQSLVALAVGQQQPLDWVISGSQRTRGPVVYIAHNSKYKQTTLIGADQGTSRPSRGIWWHSIFTLPAIGHSHPLCRPIITIYRDRDPLHTIDSLVSIDNRLHSVKIPRFWTLVGLTPSRKHLASFVLPHRYSLGVCLLPEPVGGRW